jgi:superfamily II DNA/RNA helicase
MNLNKLGLNKELSAFFEEQGFSQATPIQEKAIPIMIEKENILAIAPTGSGKTLAFALPVMNVVKNKEKEFEFRDRMAPMAVVISPTKELAGQIFGEFKSIAHHQKLRVRLSTGANETNEYKNLINSTFEILVATPSRLKTAIEKGHLDLSYCQYLVLDEADQLFDMGFSKEIGTVFSAIDKEETKIALFSATMSEGILTYIDERLPGIDWKKIFLGREAHISAKIESFNVHCGEKDKPKILCQFMAQNIKGRGIIFTNNKVRVDTLTELLKERNPKLKVKKLYGDLPGKEREATIKAFRDQKFQILIATDIAARGIDVKDLSWVINYELPKSFIYYVHRCGRVARGTNTGIVYNFISPVDQKKVAQINEVIKEQSNIDIDLIKTKKEPSQKLIDKKTRKVKDTKRTRNSTDKRGTAVEARKPKSKKTTDTRRRR